MLSRIHCFNKLYECFAIVDTKLFVDVAGVSFDGAFGNEKFAFDFCVGGSAGEQLKDFSFARTEMVGCDDRFAFLLEEEVIRRVRAFELVGNCSALPMIFVVAVKEEEQYRYEHDCERNDVDDKFLLAYRKANA